VRGAGLGSVRRDGAYRQAGRSAGGLPAPALDLLGQVTAEFAQVTAGTGRRVDADPGELITSRAALAGLTRGGQVSAGGASFLLRSADGWCAVTLSRADDVAAVPAIAGALGWDEVDVDEIETRAAARDGSSPLRTPSSPFPRYAWA
jgi:hypothetical protein